MEEFSVSSALNTLDRCNVANLVIDADEGVSHQDGGIAHTIVARGKGLRLSDVCHYVQELSVEIGHIYDVTVDNSNGADTCAGETRQDW